ncbi:L-dopachrome tautomerase-related protein [Wenyingzhuangia sp. 1_MG-2023]|nr:L-dopachrome tautomerase-related protein [Wenyingzhuangia sp. 1_MG-2023]
MNNLFALFCIVTIASCTPSKQKIKTVAAFHQQQVTGVSVSSNGRIFANFPRWREGVKNSVVEVSENGKSASYPNEKWNSWEINNPINDSVFVAVQSVVAFKNNLYVLDTRNPLFKGVKDAPRIFVFDLVTNTLKRIYIFSESSYHNNSYINDLRIDSKNNKAYLTDSGHAGLLVLDLDSGNSKRVLDNHPSTLAETDGLTFGESKWNATVHSDGIALDTTNDMLYYHALTGYSLYAIPTKTLINGTNAEIEKNVQFIQKTAAPDGMIFDKFGNLYFADLENNRIMKLNISTRVLEVFVEGDNVKWADTFSIYKDELYYTNSRINETKERFNELTFTINKVKTTN